MKQILDILKENILLDIIRYNKNIQNKLNKDLDDYFKESSKIEIEIIPKDNIYGKFINIPKEYDNYYHIYFNNNNKEEIKRKKLNEDEKISIIKVILEYKIKSFFELFYECKCLKKIYFTKLRRKDISDMSYMFYECSLLEELDLSNFKTDNVTNMSYMFYECSSLKEIDLSKFNMLHFCSSLKELNFPFINFDNNSEIQDMLYFCSSLEELNCGWINNQFKN